MKLHKAFAIALAGLSLAPLAARAADELSLQFSFEDSNGLVTGDAMLSANPVLNDPGAFLATSGNLDITAPAADGISGEYQLFQNPSAPNASTSPTGLFIYDDLVMPGSNPVVTNPGILAFGGPSGNNVPEGKGDEINFFSSGSNTYDLYTGANGNYPYSYVFSVPQGSVSAQVIVSAAAVRSAALSRSLVAAPEPSAWLIMGSFLLIGLCKLRSGEAPFRAQAL
jgi:hypothetical protein